MADSDKNNREESENLNKKSENKEDSPNTKKAKKIAENKAKFDKEQEQIKQAKIPQSEETASLEDIVKDHQRKRSIWEASLNKFSELKGKNNNSVEETIELKEIDIEVAQEPSNLGLSTPNQLLDQEQNPNQTIIENIENLQKKIEQEFEGAWGGQTEQEKQLVIKNTQEKEDYATQNGSILPKVVKLFPTTSTQAKQTKTRKVITNSFAVEPHSLWWDDLTFNKSVKFRDQNSYIDQRTFTESPSVDEWLEKIKTNDRDKQAFKLDDTFLQNLNKLSLNSEVDETNNKKDRKINEGNSEDRQSQIGGQPNKTTKPETIYTGTIPKTALAGNQKRRSSEIKLTQPITITTNTNTNVKSSNQPQTIPNTNENNRIPRMEQPHYDASGEMYQMQRMIRSAVQNLPPATNNRSALLKFLSCIENEFMTFRTQLRNPRLMKVFVNALIAKLDNPAFTVVSHANPESYEEFRRALVRGTSIIRPRSIIETQAKSLMQLPGESPLTYFYRMEDLLKEYRIAIDMEPMDYQSKLVMTTVFENEVLQWLPAGLLSPLNTVAKMQVFDTFEDFRQFLQQEKDRDDSVRFIKQMYHTQDPTISAAHLLNTSSIPTAATFPVFPKAFDMEFPSKEEAMKAQLKRLKNEICEIKGTRDRVQDERIGQARTLSTLRRWIEDMQTHLRREVKQTIQKEMERKYQDQKPLKNSPVNMFIERRFDNNRRFNGFENRRQPINYDNNRWSNYDNRRHNNMNNRNFNNYQQNYQQSYRQNYQQRPSFDQNRWQNNNQHLGNRNQNENNNTNARTNANVPRYFDPHVPKN
jgi:hypothetical protein